MEHVAATADATVVRISTTPVKGLALQHPEAVELTARGVPGDRAFFLVDERGEMVSATRLGPLVSVAAEHDEPAGRLALHFAGGDVVEGPVRLGAPEPVRFYSQPLAARAVRGPFSEALSALVGRPLRLMRTPAQRAGVDRDSAGAVTLLSRGSLRRLAQQAGVGEIDARRFRMTLELDGLDAHAEDGWIGYELCVGGARLRVAGHVGRCALTTRDPDSGRVDLPTLHVLRGYRADAASTEPLPFGVHAAVVAPGRVAVGDAVRAAPAGAARARRP